MSDAMNHIESERMVRALAHRVKRRLRTIPQAVMSYEDIEQELWIAWCKARDAFDANRGIPWAAYLQRGMKQHINRVIESQLERFEGQTFALSLDAPFGDTPGENDTTLSDLVPSNDPTPAEMIEGSSNYQLAQAVMSDRARIFVSILHEQPQELLQEVLMAQDKAEHAARIGAPYNAPRRLTTAMVFDLMGAPRSERNRITKEVQQLGVRLSR